MHSSAGPDGATVLVSYVSSIGAVSMFPIFFLDDAGAWLLWFVLNFAIAHGVMPLNSANVVALYLDLLTQHAARIAAGSL